MYFSLHGLPQHYSSVDTLTVLDEPHFAYCVSSSEARSLSVALQSSISVYWDSSKLGCLLLQ